MKPFILAASTASLFAATSAFAQPVTMDWVTVGNAGNRFEAQPQGTFGAVAYEYRIGTYEVTNAQYAAFLNAVAASDPNRLYNGDMGSNVRGGITRSGSDGSYTYSVRPNMGDKPVNYVSWFDAARMANWMTNGQPSGTQNDGTTETGVYTLTGRNSLGGVTRDLSNPNQVSIPTEDEWYKAAYHQPAAQGGDSDDYWLYAYQSNSGPTFATATSTGDVANPGPDVVNYLSRADWNGANLGNVTTVGSAGNSTFYGAFDMNGNVGEWLEKMRTRGGSFADGVKPLQSGIRNSPGATYEGSVQGFRFASPVPPPGTVALLAVGAPLLARRRRAMKPI